MPPFPSQHSTPGRLKREADPRAISGRTRYHQVRLAFHPYPQVIPRRCTTYGFGPPCAVKRTSSCSWVDHLASGLRPVTGRPIRTRFRYGSAPEGLNLATKRNSPAHTAKGTRSPVPGCGLPLHCRRTVSRSISLPSRGPFHLSLVVLVHYRSVVGI